MFGEVEVPGHQSCSDRHTRPTMVPDESHTPAENLVCAMQTDSAWHKSAFENAF